MSVRYSCSHMTTVSNIPVQEIVKSKETATCGDCSCYGPNLWICLYRDCLRIGCSEKFNDHSTLHNRKYPAHCIHMNLSTQRIWCYSCQMEVFMDAKSTKLQSRAIVYSDSDNDGESSRTCDRDSYDSGRGSYATLRAESLDRRGSSALGAPGVHLHAQAQPQPHSQPVFAFERAVGLNVAMSGDSAGDSSDSDDEGGAADRGGRTRGLVGLQNIGNTCYMNAALQALSNTPPLTRYFLDCGASVRIASEGRKPGLSRSYQRLVRDMWHRKTRGYVVPSGILYGIRNVHSMFRGYHQHDTQEFLRCFMDQLHEELKQVVSERSAAGGEAVPLPGGAGSCDTLDSFALAVEGSCGSLAPPLTEQGFGYADNYEAVNCEGTSASASQSEGEYETCDSGVSERSSLSDDTERSVSEGGRRTSVGAKRRLSRSSSPGRHARLRSKLTTSTHCPRSCSPPSVVDAQPGTSSNSGAAASSKKSIKYRSIISDVFDGKLLSSVQCLTCDRISTRVETFQDLSLPIPNRDHLAVLHGTGLAKNGPGSSSGTQSSSSGSGAAGGGALTCTEAVYPGSQDGWVAWLWTWLKSWFYGPTVSLHDCLAAFFSADELKGDNMYSCEKCNKLRNGVKFSKVIDLPEVLCIHLKRFRHELMFSSKISSQVSFPLTGLDMRPYLHKDCVSSVSSYDLISVICHHGTAGGGHYTCYSLNAHTDTWYEFDDQYVTRVSTDTVLGCEAYVLFYRKSNAAMSKCRSRACELIGATAEMSEMKFFVSRQWINKFATFAEPGPIDNSDFLCQHGGLQPDKAMHVDQLTKIVSQTVWEYLYETFGGGPACNHLYDCPICEQAAEALNKRITVEMETFMQLHREFQNMDSPATTVYAMSMNWFRQWQSFVRTRTTDPPGPIDNSNIVNQPAQPGQPETVKPGSDYSQISEELWHFFHQIYGGGPEIKLRTGAKTPVPQRSQSVSAIPCTYEAPPPPVACSDSVPEFFIPPLKPKKHPQNFDSVPGQFVTSQENEFKPRGIAMVHDAKPDHPFGEPPLAPAPETAYGSQRPTPDFGFKTPLIKEPPFTEPHLKDGASKFPGGKDGTLTVGPKNTGQISTDMSETVQMEQKDQKQLKEAVMNNNRPEFQDREEGAQRQQGESDASGGELQGEAPGDSRMDKSKEHRRRRLKCKRPKLSQSCNSSNGDSLGDNMLGTAMEENPTVK